MASVGCSQLGSLSPSDERQRLWAAHQQAASAIDDWDIRARAALRLEGQAYNISLSWKRAAEEFVMILEAPFGQGVFRIEGRGDDGYRLRLPDGQVHTNTTAEALLEDVVGWSLPISGLEYWIRGMPNPDSDFSYSLDQGGRAKSIEQDRWAIDYLDYFAAPTSPQLPRRINLRRDDLNLKLVIERWQQAELDQAPSDLFPEFD
jgi:outer membrane lipoprotein LolB